MRGAWGAFVALLAIAGFSFIIAALFVSPMLRLMFPYADPGKVFALAYILSAAGWSIAAFVAVKRVGR